jgi:hypothetical protein
MPVSQKNLQTERKTLPVKIRKFSRLSTTTCLLNIFRAKNASCPDLAEKIATDFTPIKIPILPLKLSLAKYAKNAKFFIPNSIKNYCRNCCAFPKLFLPYNSHTTPMLKRLIFEWFFYKQNANLGMVRWSLFPFFLFTFYFCLLPFFPPI